MFLKHNLGFFSIFSEKILSSVSSVSHSVMSDALRPHQLQHARLPCTSLSSRVCSNSCPLSRWCRPNSSSVALLSTCPQSFPASGSFPMSQLFVSGGQSTGASASASVLPMNIQNWFPSGWTGWISLQSKGLSGVLSNTTVQKYQFFSTQLITRLQALTHFCLPYSTFPGGRASLVPQRLKCLPAMLETRVWSLCWEDPLEKEMATHSSILAWRIPWRDEPGRLQSTGLQRVRHDWATSLSQHLAYCNLSIHVC